MAAILLALLAAQDPSEGGKTVLQAVDRLTQRLTVLKGKTRVVWLVDSSASMRDDRESLAGRIDAVFRAIPPENDLAMAVAPFSDRLGSSTPFFTNPADVRKAMLEVRGGSGRERPFGAAEEASTWFAGRGHNILVLVTDEKGDDLERLEEILDVLRNNLVNVFVMGPEAPFQWPVRYELDASGPPIPVHAGPESSGFETLAINPICCGQRGQPGYGQVYPGCRKLLVEPEIQQVARLHANANPLRCDLVFDDIGSGYGPWGLRRVAERTGGEYLTLGPAGRPEYAPGIETPWQYAAANRRDPLRRAVTEAVAEFHKGRHHGLVASTAANVGGGQKRAAERLDEKCAAWIERLETVSGEDPRWLANRDLVLVQLRAMRHYLEEYALAFERDLPGLSEPYYRVVSGPARGEGERRAEAIAAAEALAAAHPNTPWAATAGRIAGQLEGFALAGWTPTEHPIVPPQGPK